ncbi:MAG: NEW3 domain-containing protein, partial [Bacteroidota bacterium]
GVASRDLIGRPENPPALTVKVALASADGRIEVEAPVRFRSVDPVEGEQYRPFEVLPPVTLNLTEKVHVFTKQEEKTILVNVRSGGSNISGSLSLKVPEGWQVKPETIPFVFANKNEELAASFSVRPTRSALAGAFTVEATVGSKTVTHGMTTVRYSHIPPQTVFPQAEGKLLRIDVNGSKKAIAYIMGSGDEIPIALRQLGYNVTVLSDEDLANGSLSSYGVIIAGVRAYNTRPQLKTNQKKLMEFVEKGGTCIVQYVTRQRLESENLGPYPFSVSNDRVSVEEAPVRFISPNHPLLNRPNKITPQDFEGWVQERGLYFADKWDPRYTTVLASNDPGEQSKEGGLLVAQYGKGYYMYTGYAFFRQLPAGVAGAYRLFVNLISLGK